MVPTLHGDGHDNQVIMPISPRKAPSIVAALTVRLKLFQPFLLQLFQLVGFIKIARFFLFQHFQHFKDKGVLAVLIPILLELLL